MLRSLRFILLYAALACAVTTVHADSGRRELQLRQQQDALNLNLQQGMRARRYDLSPADARRLDQLDLQQRLQLQQLEQQQIQRDELSRRESGSLPPGASDAQLRAQRDAFTQERQLQIQQFELDRQRLLQSAPREPLQTPAGSQLRLP
jgi:hypothetical protein